MKDFKKYLMSKSIVSKKASLLFELGCSAYRYLAINAGSSISILITYIVFVTKMQNGKPGEMDLPLWKTISQIF
jgi:hypothetical protein